MLLERQAAIFVADYASDDNLFLGKSSSLVRLENVRPSRKGTTLSKKDAPTSYRETFRGGASSDHRLCNKLCSEVSIESFYHSTGVS